MRGAALLCALAALLLGVAADRAPAAANPVKPNDPGWAWQWALQQMRLPEVWEYTTGSPNIVIAAIDTGVNPKIVDISDALVGGWDFTDNDAVIEDTHGHGTLTASVMVARGNNAHYMAGYCWECKLMPVRVTQDKIADPFKIAAGIRWAVDHGARVVNVGFGTSRATGHESPVDAVAEAIRYAVERNVVVTASAGNSGEDGVLYPAGYPGVIAVAATDERNFLYDWSTHGGWITLAAPGCHIVIDYTEYMGELCGSSFSAPAVAGIAALALSLNPSLTPGQIAAALRATAVPVWGIGGGRVDAYAALASLGLLSGPPRPPGAAAGTPGSSTSGRPVATPSTGSGTTTGAAGSPTKFAQQAQIRVGKTVRGRSRVAFTVGGGRVDLALTLPRARECTMSVSARSEILIGTERGLDEITMRVWLPKGRYVVQIECATRRARSYALGIAGLLPATKSR